MEAETRREWMVIVENRPERARAEALVRQLERLLSGDAEEESP